MSEFMNALQGSDKELANKSDGDLMTMFCEWYEKRVLVYEKFGISHLFHGRVASTRMQPSLVMHAQTQDHADDDEDCVYVFKSTKASGGKKSVPNVCFRHLNNKCKRGAECRFTHDETLIKQIDEDTTQFLVNSQYFTQDSLSVFSLRARILLGQEIAQLKSSSQYSNIVHANNGE
jgi:hypothetical protein